MSDAISFVTLLRSFYSVILVFVAIVLLREVWFIWFDRQMTLGEIKYFDGIKVEQSAADRFRHLLSQEYNRDLDHIRNYAGIFDAVSGRERGAGVNLLSLEGGRIDPNLLITAKSFATFAAKERDFANLDISFQGIEIRKLFSSVRSYLSPSVDLNLVVTKLPGDEMRANIRWPREAYPLEGRVKRHLDFELGPYKDDTTLARKTSCYLLWLQAFNKQQKDIASFGEFCLWVDGIRMIGAIANAKDNIAVNGGPQRNAIRELAQQFAPGVSAEFYYPETYRVASTLFSQSIQNGSPFVPEVPIGAEKKARAESEFLAALLNYYFMHIVANPDRREFFRDAANRFTATDTQQINQEVVGRQLLANRVVPWSRVVTKLQPPEGEKSSELHLESILEAGDRFQSHDVGVFGFPKREVGAILRDIGPDGQWQGTAFLVAPNVALASGISHLDNKKGPGHVEYVVGPPYAPDKVAFRRIAVSKVIPLVTTKPGGVVALQLEKSIPDVTPFRLASRDRVRDRAGQAVYLVSYLGNVAWDDRFLLKSVFKGEYERPTYLAATILLQTDNDGETQYAYDAFTLPGAGGSPVMDARSGEVLAIHHSGLFYGTGFVKMAAGTDITALNDNAVLKELIDSPHRREAPK